MSTVNIGVATEIWVISPGVGRRVRGRHTEGLFRNNLRHLPAFSRKNIHRVRRLELKTWVTFQLV